MAAVEITIVAAGGAFVTPDGSDQARPVSHAATVKVSQPEADRLVADGAAVHGTEVPDSVQVAADVPDVEPEPAPWDDLATSDDDASEDDMSEDFDIDGATVEDLQAEADRLGLEIEGTGQGGNVLKADLQKALRSHQSA